MEPTNGKTNEKTVLSVNATADGACVQLSGAHAMLSRGIKQTVVHMYTRGKRRQQQQRFAARLVASVHE